MFIYIHIISYYKMFLYFNLCLSVMLDCISCSFTSILFLTNYLFILTEIIGQSACDTNYAPLLVDLILYSYETDFIQGLLKKNEKNFTFRYIDDFLWLNNSMFCDFVDRIYPIEIEIMNTKNKIQLDLLHTLTYILKLTVRVD